MHRKVVVGVFEAGFGVEPGGGGLIAAVNVPDSLSAFVAPPMEVSPAY